MTMTTLMIVVVGEAINGRDNTTTLQVKELTRRADDP